MNANGGRTRSGILKLGPPHIHHDWDADREPVVWIDTGSELTLEIPSGEGGQLSVGSTAADLAGVDWTRLHALVGPVGVTGAMPGESLQIDIIDLIPDAWGFVMHRPGVGLLESPEPYLRTVTIEGGVARFGSLLLPIRPMLGVVGVAPASGRASTRPPGPHGGNMDFSKLTIGSTVFLPVLTDGGRLSFGDPHALQGDGEVCVTGLECGMSAVVRIHRRSDLNLPVPVVEDAESLYFMGYGSDYESAATMALDAVVDWLGAELGLGFPDAYALSSLTVDLGVAQLVNEPTMGATAAVRKRTLGWGDQVLRR